MSKQVNYNENLCAGAAIRDDKGRRISKLFEASHPKMTVGYAKNLIMPDDPTEQKFNFRQSGGGVIEDGVAVIDKVKGNSVVWNQLVKPTKVVGVSGVTMTLNVDGSITLNGTATETKEATIFFKGISLIKEHKVVMYRDSLVGKNAIQVPSDKTGDFMVNVQQEGRIFTIKGTGGESTVWIKINNGDTFSNTKIHIGLSNLTQMFGAGNEPSTYEEFLSRKPKVADEYAYNEGTIVNNKVEKVVTTGRNLWDSSTAIDGKTIYDNNGAEANNSLGWCSTFIPIIGGETYFCKGVRIEAQAYGVHYYDKDKQHINGVGIPQNGRTFDAPINAKYIRIHGLYDSSPANAAILNLSDASFNGQYAPYEKHELDLSWIKEIKDVEGVKLFEDGMRSAGSAFDEAAKGRAIKRIGVMDMGKMTWFKREDISPSMFASNDIAPNNKIGLCPIASINKKDYDATLVDGALYWMGNYVMMYNSKFTTIDDFVNFVSGTPIYYELAAPIEVEYDEKNLTYPVVAGGTEEAIASEPSTAFRADIGYGIDAVKTILDLKARVEALEGK